MSSTAATSSTAAAPTTAQEESDLRLGQLLTLTDALLDAVSKGEEGALLQAIATAERFVATLQRAWTDGTGAHANWRDMQIGVDGTAAWWTSELKAAHEALRGLQLSEASNRRGEDLERAKDTLRKTLSVELATCLVRFHDVALMGSDRRGRRYWFFPQDAGRLWVERPPALPKPVHDAGGAACSSSASVDGNDATGDATAEDDSWEWAFHHSRQDVTRLISCLCGAPAAGASRASLAAEHHLREALIRRQEELMPRSAAAVDPQWKYEGRPLVGKRVRIDHGDFPAIARITRWIEADEAEGDPEGYHAVHEDGDSEDLVRAGNPREQMKPCSTLACPPLPPYLTLLLVSFCSPP